MTLIAMPSIASPFTPSLSEGSALFREIRTALAGLDTLARIADSMEEELQSFLRSYYSRMLPLTARLERLRYRKAYGRFPSEASAQEMVMTSAPAGNSILAQHKKSLFRRLAKRCHPDSRLHATVAISEVYQAKTISALWQLEIRCVCDNLPSSAEINRYLQTQLTEITSLSRRARNANQSLTFSDMWQLKERVYAAALQGEDLMEQIQRRVESQIAALQQYFVKPRILHAAA